MGGDGWGGGQHHGMRCAQADRDRCSDVLKAAWAEGRLADDEYRQRLEDALSAQTYGQLAELVQDLPVGPVGSVPPPAAVLPAAPPPFPRPHPGWYGYPPHLVPRPAPPQTNGVAIASLVIGIVSLVVAWPVTEVAMIGRFNPFPYAFGAIAAVTGHVGLHQAQTRPYPHNGGLGPAVVGLSLGWLIVVLSLVIDLGG
jgi:uncharacterized membrane protein